MCVDQFSSVRHSIVHFGNTQKITSEKSKNGKWRIRSSMLHLTLDHPLRNFPSIICHLRFVYLIRLSIVHSTPWTQHHDCSSRLRFVGRAALSNTTLRNLQILLEMRRPSTHT